MGAKNLTTPGGLVELALDGRVVGEYQAAKPGGPPRYMPSVNGVGIPASSPIRTASTSARTWTWS